MLYNEGELHLVGRIFYHQKDRFSPSKTYVILGLYYFLIMRDRFHYSNDAPLFVSRVNKLD